MQAFIDPDDGRVIFDDRLDFAEGSPSSQLIADLAPTERRIICLLYGVGCEQLPIDEVAYRMNMSVDQVWQTVEAASQLLGQLVIIEAAA